MAKFPHYKQLDQMDCGPTCLRMVAKHYGRHFTAQSLRERAQIGKEGVSMLGIAEAAEAIGFRTLGVKISFEKLAREAQLPCIVHWQQNHFVVVYDIKTSGAWMQHVFGGFRRPTVEAETPGPAPRVVYGDGPEVVFTPERPAPKSIPVRGTV